MKKETGLSGEDMFTCDSKTMDEEANDSVQMLGCVFLVILAVAVPCAFWIGWNLGNIFNAMMRVVR
ncbi:MAG: hypothetical protein ACYCOU_25225 [Sulfobacillus sp.]